MAVRVVALLSWYDERPAWLAGLTASLAGHVDHLVALDGAYALYPRSTGTSPAEQAEAIRETARNVGIGCTLHEPAHAWPGNEVEKRSFMFRLGEQVSEPADWYFIMDGDELVTEVGCDLRQRCSETDRDCGEVTMWNYREHVEPHERPFVTAMIEETTIRTMFRAVRGLAVVGNHFTYKTPDGRFLWGNGYEPLEPAENFRSVRLQHRNKSRDPWRADSAKKYYATRDKLNLEGLIP